MASGDIKVSILDCGAMTADLTWLLSMGTYLALAIGVGVLLGKLIEMPALRIRDRLFPAAAPAPAPVRVVTVREELKEPAYGYR